MGIIAPYISGRTGYHLNLHGPVVTLTTNLASSTVALSPAVDQLNSSRRKVAIVGGISVQLMALTIGNTYCSRHCRHCSEDDEAEGG